MSNLSLFLKGNKKVKENEKHVATTSICDENGVPVPWEFRHVTSKEKTRIREKCTVEVPVKGKPNVYRPKLDTDKYLEQLICKAAVFPNLIHCIDCIVYCADYFIQDGCKFVLKLNRRIYRSHRFTSFSS